MSSTEKEEKFILDATAGFRMMWFNKQHPNAVYVDQRCEVEPDIVANWKDLSQFPDSKFRLICFDPPHLIKPESYANQTTMRRFGWLNAETWQSELRQAFKELFRVLQPYGVLLFKWNNFSTNSTEVLKLCEYEPLFYNVISREQRKISDKNAARAERTVWFCFMKIPKKEISL